MNKKAIGLILLLFSSGGIAQSDSVYEYKGMTVSVLLSDNETVQQAVSRAESLLQINAVTKTPKFVSHTTNYDSRTDEILEKGVIAQGADVRVFNTRYTKDLEGEQVRLNVAADITVDISAMKAKIYSEKRERLMESTIDDLTMEYNKLSAVLDKVRNNIALSTLDSLVVTDYYAKLNSTFGMLDGDIIVSQLNAHRNGTTPEAKLQAEIVLAYEQFVLPFMKNPKINYQVIDIIPHKHAVAEIKVKVTIERVGNNLDQWYPAEKIGANSEYCEKFFFGCSSLFDHSESNANRAIKDIITPRYCSRTLFEYLPYKFAGAKTFGNEDAEDGIYCGRYDENSRYYHGWEFIKFNNQRFDLDKPVMPELPNVFTEAFKELSRRSYWLLIYIGTEKFKVNISNIYINEFTISAFMPERTVSSGVKISFSVQEEKYDSDAKKWTDMNGRFLRYQTREIGFY